MKKIQKGQFYTVRGLWGQGHKGRAVTGIKNGKAKFVTVTSKKRMRVKNNKGEVVYKGKTIRLKSNPEKGNPNKSYVAPRPVTIKQKDIKKHHPEMQVNNSRDKSIFRNVGKRQPLKKIKKK